MTTKTEAVPTPSAESRADGFKTEIHGMKIKDPKPERDARFIFLGSVLMAVGVLAAIVAYFISHGTNSTLTQNDSLTIGLAGIALSVAGGAIFVRYSLSSFFRFWMARLIFEQQKGRD